MYPKSVMGFLTLLFILITHNSQHITIFAQEMTSQNFKIQGGNLNMTSGNKESTNFKLSDVVGQTAAGVFLSKGYIINAGFQNSAAGETFSFSVNPNMIDFGELIPDTPVEKGLRLAISNGNVPGYLVQVSENQPLSTIAGAQIVDTVCDQDYICTPASANRWSQNTTYGFGYKIIGRTTPQDFRDANFYRPFPATFRNEQPAVIMQSQARKVIDQATMTLRLNTGRSQPVGQYRNVISFIAMAGI